MQLRQFHLVEKSWSGGPGGGAGGGKTAIALAEPGGAGGGSIGWLHRRPLPERAPARMAALPPMPRWFICRGAAALADMGTRRARVAAVARAQARAAAVAAAPQRRGSYPRQRRRGRRWFRGREGVVIDSVQKSCVDGPYVSRR